MPDQWQSTADHAPVAEVWQSTNDTGAPPSLGADLIKYSPVGMVQGLASMIRTAASGSNPLAGMAEANAKILDKAKASFKDGNYGQAAVHFANYLNPFGGAFEDVSQDLADGNYGHAAAKFTGLLSNAAVAPAMETATSPELAAGAAKIPAATAAAIKAAAPDVAAGAAKAVVGEVLAKVPGAEWPVRIGVQYPAIRQVAKGGAKGVEAFKAAMAEEPASAPAPAAAPAPEPVPRPAPAEPALAMNSQGGPAAAIAAPPGIYQAQPRPASDLAPNADVNGRIIPMPPVSMEYDTSGPIRKPGAEAPTRAAPAPVPAKAAPAEPAAPKYDGELLDGLAQWAFKKNFKDLSKPQIASVMNLADQGTTKTAAPPTVAPTLATPPEPAPEAAPVLEPEPQSMEAAEKHPAHAANAVIAADRWAANLKSLAVAAPALDDSAAWGKLAEGLDERPGYVPSMDTREMIRERMPAEPSEIEKQLRDSIAAAQVRKPGAEPSTRPSSAPVGGGGGTSRSPGTPDSILLNSDSAAALRAKSKAAFEAAKNAARP